MSDKEGSDSEAEIDPRSWSTKPRMPALCAWEKAVSKERQAPLVAAAQAMFSNVGNVTYWVGATDAPQTLMEQFALQVFWYHVKRLGWSRDALARLGQVAGAEYWVQKRSPRQPLRRRSINWHYDKDEALIEDYGIMIHPVVATATYFCQGGAPLVALTKPLLNAGPDCTVDLPTKDSVADAFMVFPCRGRHVAFRGSMLHGCPAELEGQQTERLSILVNVWLHHRPFDMIRWRPRTRLSAQSLCRGRGKLLRVFSPGPSVKPQRTRFPLDSVNGSCSSFKVPAIFFGPWQLRGLRLPSGLSKGVWVVRQPPRQLAVSARGERRQVRRRPAASRSGEERGREPGKQAASSQASRAAKRRQALPPTGRPRKRPATANAV